MRNWCDRFDSQFARCAKGVRGRAGSTWHLDEVFVKLRGKPYVLWRAVDEHGTELDVLLQKRGDKAAAKHLFRKVLRSHPVPRTIVTDQLHSYPAAKAEVPELVGVKHAFVKASWAIPELSPHSLSLPGGRWILRSQGPQF